MPKFVIEREIPGAGSLTPAELQARLGERGVKLLPIGGRRLRAVTHYGIEADDIEVALAIVRGVMKQL